MMTAARNALAATALALTLGGCARNAILEIRVNLPDPSVAIKTTMGNTFSPHGAVIAVLGDDPGDTSIRRFNDRNGRVSIDIANWSPDTRDVIAVDTEGLDRTVYVIVRLCEAVEECDATSFNARTQRDFVWKIERPFFKGKFTSITLPIPGGPNGDPDNTTGLTGSPANLYGCVLDEWAWAGSQTPTSLTPTPIELNRCFVYSPECRDGVKWGCDSELVSGTAGAFVCDLAQTNARHFCE